MAYVPSNEFLDTTSDVQIFAVSKINYTIQFALLYSECTVHCTHIHVQCILVLHKSMLNLVTFNTIYFNNTGTGST